MAHGGTGGARECSRQTLDQALEILRQHGLLEFFLDAVSGLVGAPAKGAQGFPRGGQGAAQEVISLTCLACHMAKVIFDSVKS